MLGAVVAALLGAGLVSLSMVSSDAGPPIGTYSSRGIPSQRRFELVGLDGVEETAMFVHLESEFALMRPIFGAKCTNIEVRGPRRGPPRSPTTMTPEQLRFEHPTTLAHRPSLG